MFVTVLLIVTIAAAFICVAALVAAGAAVVRARAGTPVEARLDALAKISLASKNEVVASGDSVLLADGAKPAVWEQWLSRYLDLSRYIQQAGVQVAPAHLILVTALLAAVGGVAGAASPIGPLASLLGACLAASLPPLWLFFKRYQRLGKFESQMPDALDLLARSLRAGHSLADGLRLIGEEMREPIGAEFQRCYQQQALGIPMEDTLESMTARVPNPDLRFFVNAIVLQRQTGGDTAQVLDKIATLVRQRFQIRNQVKALTGEGRLSGAVLLGMPIALAVYMYFRNPKYLMLLFQDPLGQKMLCGAIVLQLIGAVVIKKIVAIKI